MEFPTHVWLRGGMTGAPMPRQAIYESESQWEQVEEWIAEMERQVWQAVGCEELHEVEDGLFRRR